MSAMDELREWAKENGSKTVMINNHYHTANLYYVPSFDLLTKIAEIEARETPMCVDCKECKHSCFMRDYEECEHPERIEKYGSELFPKSCEYFERSE